MTELNIATKEVRESGLHPGVYPEKYRPPVTSHWFSSDTVAQSIYDREKIEYWKKQLERGSRTTCGMKEMV